jgi:hypothetical protein
MALARPSGRLTISKLGAQARPQIRTVLDAVRYGTPQPVGIFASRARRRVAEWQEANASNFERSLEDQARFQHGLPMSNRLGAIGHLWLRSFDHDGAVTDYGLVSCRVVTDAGVQFMIDAFQGLVTLDSMKYHALGTGTTAESAAQTALVTELTTQYATSNTRPTGTLGEKSGDAKTFETSATITVSASVAATEHGIFSTASSGTGVMLDRSVFAAINLANTESIQSTYQLTIPSGS